MILQTRHFAPKNYGIVRTTPYHFPPRDLTTRMSHDARISLTGQNTDAMLSLSRLTSSLRELAHGGQDEVGPIVAGLVSEAWELILKIPLDGDGETGGDFNPHVTLYSLGMHTLFLICLSSTSH